MAELVDQPGRKLQVVLVDLKRAGVQIFSLNQADREAGSQGIIHAASKSDGAPATRHWAVNVYPRFRLAEESLPEESRFPFAVRNLWPDQPIVNLPRGAPSAGNLTRHAE